MTSAKLGDVLDKIIDCEHKTAPETIGEVYAYSVGTPHLKEGRILYSQAKPISQETYLQWTKRGEPEAGDLILAREAPVGQVGLVGNVRVALGQRTVLLKVNKKLCVPRYLHYKLISPRMQRLMQAWSEGSTVAHLNVKDISKLDIGNLPPLSEQRRVAEILGSLDDKIEANNALIDSLSELAIAEVERLGIFSGEADRVLEDIIEFSPRVPKPVGGSYQFVDMSVLPTSGPVAGQIQVKDKWTGSKFVEGDTLFSRITPCLENGKTAIAMGLGSQPAVGSTEFIVMRARGLHRELLAYGVARSRRFREIATQKMTGTSGRQRVKWQDLAIIPVSTARLDDFVLSSAEFDLLRSLRQENIELLSVREFIIHNLFRGGE